MPAYSDRVRIAHMSDIPRLVELGGKLHAELALDTPFDAAKLQKFFQRLVASSKGVIFAAGEPTGCVLAIQEYESPILPSKCALELLIWVEPERRSARLFGELVKEALQWARDHGCDSLQLSSQASLRGKALGRLLGRYGFRPTDTNYVRAV